MQAEAASGAVEVVMLPMVDAQGRAVAGAFGNKGVEEREKKAVQRFNTVNRGEAPSRARCQPRGWGAGGSGGELWL